MYPNSNRVKQRTKEMNIIMHKYVFKHNLNNSTLCSPITAYTIANDSIDPDQAALFQGR